LWSDHEAGLERPEQAKAPAAVSRPRASRAEDNADTPSTPAPSISAAAIAAVLRDARRWAVCVAIDCRRPAQELQTPDERSAFECLVLALPCHESEASARWSILLPCTTAPDTKSDPSYRSRRRESRS